jgi:hypothetical protein
MKENTKIQTTAVFWQQATFLYNWIDYTNIIIHFLDMPEVEREKSWERGWLEFAIFSYPDSLTQIDEHSIFICDAKNITKHFVWYNEELWSPNVWLACRLIEKSAGSQLHLNSSYFNEFKIYLKRGCPV